MSLVTLPTELVENIANHLDIAAFRSFRLVSRSLEQQSAHYFKGRCFQRRTITWTVESFQTALIVASHPFFGSALQDLVIDATPRDAILLWTIRSGTPFDTHSFAEEEYEITKREAAILGKRWNETLFDQKSLIKLFEPIPVLQSITFSYEGMDKRFGKFGRRYCETSQNEMSRPFVSTMSAVVASKIIVKNIFLHKEKNYGAVSIGRLESLSPVLSKFETAFEQLQHLSLNLRDWRYPEQGFEPVVGKTSFAVRFLSKCKHIRSLELSCYSTFEEDIFAEMAKHCKYPYLEICKISLFRIYAIDDFITFLKHSESLRSLSLDHVVLRGDNTEWSELFRRMASELPVHHMESIEFKRLFSRMGSSIQFLGPWACREVVRLKSPNYELRESLLSIADLTKLNNSGPAWHVAPVSYPFIGMRI